MKIRQRRLGYTRITCEHCYKTEWRKYDLNSVDAENVTECRDCLDRVIMEDILSLPRDDQGQPHLPRE